MVDEVVDSMSLISSKRHSTMKLGVVLLLVIAYSSNEALAFPQRGEWYQYYSQDTQPHFSPVNPGFPLQSSTVSKDREWHAKYESSNSVITKRQSSTNWGPLETVTQKLRELGQQVMSGITKLTGFERDRDPFSRDFLQPSIDSDSVLPHQDYIFVPPASSSQVRSTPPRTQSTHSLIPSASHGSKSESNSGFSPVQALNPSHHHTSAHNLESVEPYQYVEPYDLPAALVDESVITYVDHPTRHVAGSGTRGKKPSFFTYMANDLKKAGNWVMNMLGMDQENDIDGHDARIKVEEPHLDQIFASVSHPYLTKFPQSPYADWLYQAYMETSTPKIPHKIENQWSPGQTSSPAEGSNRPGSHTDPDQSVASTPILTESLQIDSNRLKRTTDTPPQGIGLAEAQINPDSPSNEVGLNNQAEEGLLVSWVAPELLEEDNLIFRSGDKTFMKVYDGKLDKFLLREITSIFAPVSQANARPGVEGTLRPQPPSELKAQAWQVSAAVNLETKAAIENHDLPIDLTNVNTVDLGQVSFEPDHSAPPDPEETKTVVLLDLALSEELGEDYELLLPAQARISHDDNLEEQAEATSSQESTSEPTSQSEEKVTVPPTEAKPTLEIVYPRSTSSTSAPTTEASTVSEHAQDDNDDDGITTVDPTTTLISSSVSSTAQIGLSQGSGSFHEWTARLEAALSAKDVASTETQPKTAPPSTPGPKSKTTINPTIRTASLAGLTSSVLASKAPTESDLTQATATQASRTKDRKAQKTSVVPEGNTMNGIFVEDVWDNPAHLAEEDSEEADQLRDLLKTRKKLLNQLRKKRKDEKRVLLRTMQSS
eukprot:maker-scaffold186_size273091-snap-gene-1.29 protein:Tk00912 transcript:maker-scaffold186_size273091-snap-gene-1.29-mRNA-1 annotation:"papilin-like isoform x3"